MPPRPSPTHFICLPLASTQLTRSLAAFRTDVTDASSFGVPGESVRPPGTLHLTLGVMSLRPDGLSQAIDALHSLRPRDIVSDIRTAGSHNSTNNNDSGINNGGLSVTLRGLHSMTAASKAAVLYAPPTDREGILYKFCEQLRKPFIEVGLIEDDNRPLLLHATIVNTIYVKMQGGGRRRERLMLDATDMLGKYENFIWADDVPLKKVAICRMGAKKIEGSDGDEAYVVEAEIGI